MGRKGVSNGGIRDDDASDRRYDLQYWLAKNKAVIDFDDYDTLDDADWIERKLPTLTKLADWPH